MLAHCRAALVSLALLTLVTGIASPAIGTAVAKVTFPARGGGLDPDISPAAALYQTARVAKARKMARDAVRELVERHTQGRSLGVFGEPRVNVLELNLALDGIRSS